ncbi:unnamed protein product [Trifolium pratense]|uniref:Uncharacterized protein n=1 Tax=Trifolium pratense TaxID=57577 RepID=A0ACB0MEI8_TRIPR|nr:unnamed protein product [Trifolium pratense]
MNSGMSGLQRGNDPAKPVRPTLALLTDQDTCYRPNTNYLQPVKMFIYIKVDGSTEPHKNNG